MLRCRISKSFFTEELHIKCQKGGMVDMLLIFKIKVERER